MAFENKKIGDVCTIRRGASPRPIKDYIADEGMPWVKISDATSANSRYLYRTDECIIEKGVSKSVTVEPETLIVSNSATPGLPMIMKIKACVHDGWLVFSDFNGVTRDYLYYKFIDIRRSLVNQANGSVFMNLKTDIVRNFDIMVPPIAVQNRIVNILLAIDEKIEKNNQINRNLLEQARLLYKSWFMDFDNNGGVMPDDWHIGAVSEIIELHDSKRKPLSGNERDKLEKIYPYYGATSIMDYVDDYLFDGIYLLLGEDGSVIDAEGYPILQYVFGKFWCNNHAHIITGKNGFSVEALYLLFSLTHVNDIVTGAVQLKISQQNLNKVEAVIPSLVALKEFDEIIQPMFGQIRKLRLENENLIKIRDSLLPKLMSGEMDVSDLDI